MGTSRQLGRSRIQRRDTRRGSAADWAIVGLIWSANRISQATCLPTPTMLGWPSLISPPFNSSGRPRHPPPSPTHTTHTTHTTTTLRDVGGLGLSCLLRGGIGRGRGRSLAWPPGVDPGADLFEL